MNIKRITGIALLIIGVVLIIYSIYSRNQISQAKSQIHSLTGTFSGNPVGKMFGSEMENVASRYDSTVMILLTSGIVLAVAGSGIVFYYRKK